MENNRFTVDELRLIRTALSDHEAKCLKRARRFKDAEQQEMLRHRAHQAAELRNRIVVPSIIEDLGNGTN